MLKTPKINAMGLWSLLCLLFIVSWASTTQAQWSNNPVADSGGIYESVAVMDDDGAKFLVWSDNSGNSSQIMAQKLDSHGRKLWGPDGVGVHPTSSNFNQVEPTAASDGNGGLVVCWTDERVSSHNVSLYSMRLNELGQEMWPAGLRGNLVCNALGDHSNSSMVPDNQGGFYVVFEDDRNGNPGVYSQYINGNGDRLWDGLGVKIRETDSECTSIGITTLPSGGAAFVWREARELAPFFVWVQAVNDDGDVLWADGGVRALGNSRDHFLPRIANCGQGSLMVASYSKAGNDHFAEVTRLDESNGTTLWGNYMMHDYLFVSSIRSFEMTPASDGGAYLVFGINAAIGSDYTQIRRAAPDPRWLGTAFFQTNHIDKIVCKEINPGILAVAFSDPSIEAVSCWGYDFTDPESPSDIWFEEEFGTPEYGEQLSIAAVHGRGLLLSWVFENDMYATFIDQLGHQNHGFPQINTLTDIPNDQGGWLTLNWEASTLESTFSHPISQYSMWLRNAGFDPAKAQAVSPSEVEKMASESGTTIGLAVKMLSQGWSYIASVPAYQQETYSALVPSPANQSEAGTPKTQYMVIAHDLTPGHFYKSEYALGISVDNLAPGAPGHLNGDYSNGNVDLQWNAVADQANDLAEYHVHSSSVPDFIPSPSNYLGMTYTTGYTDVGVTNTQYYAVTAKDVHGNEGAPSSEIEVTPGTSSTNLTPNVFKISGAHPNPFNPNTAFNFSLPATSWVDVDILDLRGNRVNSLMSETLSTGFHEMRWNGRDESGRLVTSGVYFAQVRSLFGTQTVKMTLAK